MSLPRENCKDLYSQAKRESNRGNYAEAASLFCQAASSCETEGEKVWASKAYACAAWNYLPLKEFDSVKRCLDKAAELDNCHAIEGLIVGAYWCLYFGRIERGEKKDVFAASQYSEKASEYLSYAIHLIYKWINFSFRILKNHKIRFEKDLVSYLAYILDVFFQGKIKKEKKHNPQWIESNRARHARVVQSLDQDYSHLEMVN